MQVKVNVNLLGYRPGDIVKEGDRYYEDFKAWAVRKDTRNGAVICEPCEAVQPKIDEPQAPPGPTGYIRPEGEEEASGVADDTGSTYNSDKRMKAVRAAKNGPSKERAE